MKVDIRIPRWLKIAAFILLFLLVVQILRNRADSCFRFDVANGQLFAIEMGHSYGTEVAVYTTTDEGNTWRRFDAPDKTLCFGGYGDDLLALTSSNQVWRRSHNSDTWALLVTLPGTHHYSILVDRKGRFLVGGINELTFHDRDGKLLRRFIPDGSKGNLILFGDALFTDDAQQKVLVQANPFSVYLFNLADQRLENWANELQLAPPHTGGIDHVGPFGQGFIVGAYDGVYVTKGLNEPLQQIYEFERTGNLDDEFCRDVVACEKDDQWLMATNVGIRLFHGRQFIRTIFSDSTGKLPNQDDHDLILQIVPYGKNYFVSFSRLKNQAIGVRLDGKLDSWTTLRLSANK